ncbi:MAG: class I SAM-dependent methyltransferase [Myxococcota bacterium]|nr:class I SAM-dependent methyltransferase [Myxococcota bacterium]
MEDLLQGVEVDGEAPRLEGERLVTRRGPVGTRSARRLVYERPADPELAARVEVERRLFDLRSAVLEARVVQRPAASSPMAWLDLRLRDNPRLAHVAGRLPDLAGARVLELGGSGEVTRALLLAGASRVDQLDVSPGMLRLARARLTPEERERVVQHVTFAERLPFAARTFDLVYTRHCLHHMDRARVIPEAARVLRPGGAMVVIEPYLPPAIKLAARVRRRLVRAERGTDDPLGPDDLALLRARFADVAEGGEPSVATLLRALPRRLRAGAQRADRHLPGAAARWVGGRVFVIARRPR